MQHDATYDTANVANVKRRGTFEEYRYDPLGRRVLVIGRAQSDTLCNQTGCSSYQNRVVWNGDHLIWEQYRGNTNVYVNGLGIDRPLKIRNMIPHADYRGVYDAGNQATGQAISANYPGRNFGAFHDEGVPRLTGLFASVLQGGTDQSGLAYRRNRYYDPATGRFTQQDPIGIAGGLNLYGYANGDPVNFSDPFGLAPDPDPEPSLYKRFTDWVRFKANSGGKWRVMRELAKALTAEPQEMPEPPVRPTRPPIEAPAPSGTPGAGGTPGGPGGNSPGAGGAPGGGGGPRPRNSPTIRSGVFIPLMIYDAYRIYRQMEADRQQWWEDCYRAELCAE